MSGHAHDERCTGFGDCACDDCWPPEVSGGTTETAQPSSPDPDVLADKVEALEEAYEESERLVGLLEEALRALRAQFERAETTARTGEVRALMSTAREFWRGRVGAFEDAIDLVNAALAGVETGPGKEHGNTGDASGVVVEDSAPSGDSAEAAYLDANLKKEWERAWDDADEAKRLSNP